MSDFTRCQYTCHSSNITETRHLTNTLRQAQCRPYNSANQLILTVDNQGITTTVNSQLSRLYQYNQRGLLITATVDSLVTTFLYDGQGRGLQMSVAGQATTTYILDYSRHNQVLHEARGAFAQTKHYLYGLECIAELVDAATANEEWRYYHRDGQPLVRQTSNEAAELTMAWAYSPEGGVVIGPQGPVTNLDCGAIYDWSTGLIFKQGRYFDPSTGIWITLGGVVLWQKTPRLNRARGRWLRKHHRLLLFLCLIMVVLLLTGCVVLNPDPTLIPTITPCPEPVAAASTPIPPLPPPAAATLILTVTPRVLYEQGGVFTQTKHYLRGVVRLIFCIYIASLEKPGFLLRPKDALPGKNPVSNLYRYDFLSKSDLAGQSFYKLL